jgi:hypothetical protein
VNLSGLDVKRFLSLLFKMIFVCIAIYDLITYVQSSVASAQKEYQPPHFQSNVSRFAVVGDTRSQIPSLGSSEIWPQILASMNHYFQHQEMTHLLHLGDLVKNGKDLGEWARLVKEMPPTLWAIQGNHDRGAFFHEYFQKPILDHLQIHENACVWGFNTEVHETLAIEQVLDLIMDLEWGTVGLMGNHAKRLNEIDRVMCAFSPVQIWLQHRPVYSTGPHGTDELGWNHWLVPVLHRLEIDLHLSGHDHFYERRKHHGIMYVVSGGGTRFSAPLWWRPSEKEILMRGGWVHWLACEISDQGLGVKVMGLDHWNRGGVEDMGGVVDEFRINLEILR